MKRIALLVVFFGGFLAGCATGSGEYVPYSGNYAECQEILMQAGPNKLPPGCYRVNRPYGW